MQEVTTGMREKQIVNMEWTERRMGKKNKTNFRQRKKNYFYILENLHTCHLELDITYVYVIMLAFEYRK